MLRKCPVEEKAGVVTSATLKSLYGYICQKRKQNALGCEHLLSAQFPGLRKITWFKSKTLKTFLGQTG